MMGRDAEGEIGSVQMSEAGRRVLAEESRHWSKGGTGGVDHGKLRNVLGEEGGEEEGESADLDVLADSVMELASTGEATEASSVAARSKRPARSNKNDRRGTNDRVK